MNCWPDHGFRDILCLRYFLSRSLNFLREKEKMVYKKPIKNLLECNFSINMLSGWCLSTLIGNLFNNDAAALMHWSHGDTLWSLVLSAAPESSSSTNSNLVRFYEERQHLGTTCHLCGVETSKDLTIFRQLVITIWEQTALNWVLRRATSPFRH